MLVRIMLIPRSVTAGYSGALKVVSDSGATEIDRLLGSISEESVKVQREALRDTIPVLGDQYVSAVSQISAVFFDELMQLQHVPKAVPADVMELPDVSSWTSLVGFSTTDRILERGGLQLMYSLIAGGFTKRLTESAADTIVGNARIQPEPMRSQRVPSSGCCAFCGMLASRFAGYKSSKSAGTVVGRGMPVESTIIGYDERGNPIRKRGGQARGIRPRGARSLGEKFHDSCRCTIVAVTAENEVQLQRDAEKYYDSYRDSADKVNDGLSLEFTQHRSPDGTLRNDYRWVDRGGRERSSKQTTGDILSAMRMDLGVK